MHTGWHGDFGKRPRKGPGKIRHRSAGGATHTAGRPRQRRWLRQHGYIGKPIVTANSDGTHTVIKDPTKRVKR